MKKIYVILFVSLIAASCSTTKHIPANDYLYTGMNIKINKNNELKGLTDEALDEVTAALTYPPNNAIFGSGSARWPIPFGLWMYNLTYGHDKGVGGFINRMTASTPVLLSDVNADIRTKTTTNLLHDYGFMRGYVAKKEVTKGRKCKILYTVNPGHPFTIDSIAYAGFPHEMDSLIKVTAKDRLIHKGQIFSITDLGNERDRIVDLMRSKGYYYFNSNYIVFDADTLNAPGNIMLRLSPRKDNTGRVYKKWFTGKRDVYILGDNTPSDMKLDSVTFKDITFHSPGKKLIVKPEILYDCFRLMPDRPYSSTREDRTVTRFSRLNVFRSNNLFFTPIPADSTHKRNLLDVRMISTIEQRYATELNFNFVTKSNDQLGPSAVFTLSKRNIFGGGELLSLNLKGSYEWQTTGTQAYNNQDKTLLNSYEVGTTLSLSIPRLLLPHESLHERRGTPSTMFSVNLDLLNRAHYFRMFSLGSEVTYKFQPAKYKEYEVTPFSLTYNLLNAKTSTFDSIMNANPGLKLSLSNKFIPAQKFTYTYDNTGNKAKRNHLWWSAQIKSAGNITSLAYKIFGQSFNKQKDIMGNPFAQFLKATGEIRYDMKISNTERLVSRLFGGAIYSYGNATVAPYSEQFYIGGANSLRAFTIRSIGPGRYRPADNSYSYMDQTGDLKLEANTEYRFKLAGSMNGAFFTDAGNIWTIRKDNDRPGSQFSISHLPNDLAWDIGFGIRYDLSYLVVRVDAGYALHVPYENDVNGYFNMRKSFKDALGIHIAIGYPF